MSSKKYGYNSANKLRNFSVSIACTQCGLQMTSSKRDPNSYTCKRHPEQTRTRADVDSERKYFEFLKTALINSGSKGIMIHEIIKVDGRPARGNLKAFLPIETISNPSMSWPIAFMIEQSLFAIGKKSEDYIEILKSKDGLYGITWRLSSKIASKVDKSSDMISLSIDAVRRLTNGALISGVYAESALNNEAITYINACQLSDSEDSSPVLKSRLSEIIFESKNRLPKL